MYMVEWYSLPTPLLAINELCTNSTYLSSGFSSYVQYVSIQRLFFFGRLYVRAHVQDPRGSSKLARGYFVAIVLVDDD